jgi:hypothetical protein
MVLPLTENALSHAHPPPMEREIRGYERERAEEEDANDM